MIPFTHDNPWCGADRLLITRTPGVYGGRLCLVDTRYPVTQVAIHHREGMTAEEIAADYSLSLTPVYAAITYYLANRAAVDAEIDEDERLYQEAAAADRLRRASAS